MDADLDGTFTHPKNRARAPRENVKAARPNLSSGEEEAGSTRDTGWYHHDEADAQWTDRDVDYEEQREKAHKNRNTEANLCQPRKDATERVKDLKLRRPPPGP